MTPILPLVIIILLVYVRFYKINKRSIQHFPHKYKTANCDAGPFQMNLTDEGFTFLGQCNRLPLLPVFETARKVNTFRPTDDQCELLYVGNDTTLEGNWNEVKSGRSLDICFKTSDPKNSFTVHASYDTVNENSYYYPNVGFFEGFHFVEGKIMHGTWYEDFNGGSWLAFLRNTGELKIFKWTGLMGTKGATIFTPDQYRQADLHSIETYSNRDVTDYAACNRNRKISTFVLENLPVVYPYHANGFYYFLDTFISYPYYNDFGSKYILYFTAGVSPLVPSMFLLVSILILNFVI